jgi:glutamate racemase
LDHPIGIFDSGIGGLTVLKAIKKALPGEKLIYLGDTARVPYGNKSKDTIIRYSIENTQFLLNFGIKLLVVACNTSTATSLKTLQEMFSIPIVGVIEPGAKKAVHVTRTKRIGVIGTEATVKSGAYSGVIKSYQKSAVVISKPCPLFVPIVEEGLTKGKIAEDIITHYLASFKELDIDTIVLGCTHYPLLKYQIRKFFKGKVKIVDSANETSAAVKNLLLERIMLNKDSRQKETEFYVTDAAERFLKVGKTIMSGDMNKVTLIPNLKSKI